MSAELSTLHSTVAKFTFKLLAVLSAARRFACKSASSANQSETNQEVQRARMLKWGKASSSHSPSYSTSAYQSHDHRSSILLYRNFAPLFVELAFFCIARDCLLINTNSPSDTSRVNAV
ncbi:unnamed protein product [Protopolystoma xenopodis]|uniref:Uncharacterized protein n=1 Tax=Protopolystoma xenopodis TaxID=117903 RepID=A0A448WNL3_9PLAT|nr:unnamed protein product [Protopolystoma xenopodis]